MERHLAIIYIRTSRTLTQIALHLEELSNIRPIRQGNFRDIEKFAGILDMAVLNLKQNGKEDELGGGYLYSELTKKDERTIAGAVPKVAIKSQETRYSLDTQRLYNTRG